MNNSAECDYIEAQHSLLPHSFTVKCALVIVCKMIR